VCNEIGILVSDLIYCVFERLLLNVSGSKEKKFFITAEIFFFISTPTHTLGISSRKKWKMKKIFHFIKSFALPYGFD
jgi:hypothetical protein